MKFHRVLLFTSVQMDITQVGKDLHVLLTNEGSQGIIATAYAVPQPDTDPVECIVTGDEHIPNMPYSFCAYVADSLAKQTKQNVLCTGGLWMNEEELTDRQVDKLFENIDEIIWDWIHFLD